MRSVEVVATATIWSMFSCFLLFPRLGLPAVWHRTAMALLAGELVALGAWSYGRPGEPAAEIGRQAAGIDVPLLSLALILFAIAHGLRAHRRQAMIYFRRDEDPRHRLSRQGGLGDRDRAG
jgi:hypothetical protein